MEEKVSPTINVRQLISVFENNTARPRARSLGNVLGRDVIVKSHDYNSLTDIQNGLEIVEKNLNHYEVYNKRKHVEFQEGLFTLLTSVINIEADANEDPVRKKNLISQTQKLVSFLNQKLPNSAFSPTSPKRVSENVLIKTDGSEGSRKHSSSRSEVQNKNYENQFSGSAQRARNNYQSGSELTNNVHLEVEKPHSITSNVLLENTSSNEEQPTLLSLLNDVAATPNEETEKIDESISVTKLRSLFEQKENENKRGLQLIIKPKAFQYQVHIPYTAETLGRYRLFRANSGNYMNNLGLLHRADVKYSKSTQDINSFSYEPFEEIQEKRKNSLEVNDIGSDISSEESDSESLESVKEAKTGNSIILQGEIVTKFKRLERNCYC